MWITPGLRNTINWCVTGPMLTTNRTEENFMVSGFGPEEAEKTCQMIKHLQIPYGGTLERLIQNTARNNINKILVEEKVNMQGLSKVFFFITRPPCCVHMLKGACFIISYSITRPGTTDAQCSLAKVRSSSLLTLCNLLGHMNSRLFCCIYLHLCAQFVNASLTVTSACHKVKRRAAPT